MAGLHLFKVRISNSSNICLKHMFETYVTAKYAREAKTYKLTSSFKLLN